MLLAKQYRYLQFSNEGDSNKDRYRGIHIEESLLTVEVFGFFTEALDIKISQINLEGCLDVGHLNIS
jgi:hypothetical protein